MPAFRAVVIGANGALGQVVAKTFAGAGCHVLRADVAGTSAADFLILPSPSTTYASNLSNMLKRFDDFFSRQKVDAILNVAGGWEGGNAADGACLQKAITCFEQSIASSIFSAHLATKLLKPGGLLVLPGAAGAAGPTPGMIAYGASKAAVHHLVASLAAPGSGLESATVVGIAPGVLDTPANRQYMTPDASWVSCGTIAELLLEWAQHPPRRPPSGLLVSHFAPN